MSDYAYACCGTKPCPFCAAHPVVGRVGSEDGNYFQVACSRCNGANGRPFVGVHADSREDAIQIWNHRVGR